MTDVQAAIDLITRGTDAVLIEAELVDSHLRLTLGFSVEYSSTCPASAALSRQANAERFAGDFAAAHRHDDGLVASKQEDRSKGQRERQRELPLGEDGALSSPVSGGGARVLRGRRGHVV